jgi:ornithine cyclodeaminase/alanine dehydrogenase-like protein (mu-crystallin family)
VRPPDAAGFMGLMPAYRGGAQPAFGLKAINVIPDNPRLRGLDAHQGGVLLSDGESGEPVAFLNASAITEIRTAAVSAVATRALAREDGGELAVLGAGVQARSHLEAMAALGLFQRARIWSRTDEHARRLAGEAETPFPVEAVGSAEQAVRGADVIVTATAATDPVVQREWVADGAHINAVGTRTVADAAFFTDRRESAENEAGDFVLARDEGAIGPEHIRAELGEVLAGTAAGRSSDDEITIFESLGLAIEDLAAADHVVQRARAEGVGVDVPF